VLGREDSGRSKAYMKIYIFWNIYRMLQLNVFPSEPLPEGVWYTQIYEVHK
jgi:hypothetical protein